METKEIMLLLISLKVKTECRTIKNIFANVDISEAAYGSKDNVEIANSDFLNGLNYKEATQKAIAELEKIGQGTGKTNYRLRDAVFSRQRYWGEPFPVYYVNGLPKMIDAATFANYFARSRKIFTNRRWFASVRKRNNLGLGH